MSRGKLSSAPYSRALARWEGDLGRGAGWYSDALATLGMLASFYAIPLDRIVNAFAVLSPQLDVMHNMESLLACITGPRYPWAPTAPQYRRPGYGLWRHCALGANVDKAYRCLDGDTDAVRGPKVTAFRDAILGTGALVLDVWALRAAGFRGPGDVPSPRVRDAIVRAYASRARRAGVPLSHYQASVWLAIRDAQGQGGTRRVGLVSEALAYLTTTRASLDGRVQGRLSL